MEIKSGQIWKAKNGDYYTIMTKGEAVAKYPYNTCMPGVPYGNFVGVCVWHENLNYPKWTTFNESGENVYDDSFDLLEFIKNVMKFEVGKFYKTRDGKKAEVLKMDLDGVYQVLAIVDNKDVVLLTNDGVQFDSQNSPNDLISEWKEKKEIKIWAIVNRYGVVLDSYCNEDSAKKYCETESGEFIVELSKEIEV